MKAYGFVLWVGVVCLMIMDIRDAFGSGEVKLGAIFALSSINGKVSQIAMKAAVDDINSDPTILDGRNLSLHIHDSNYSGFLSIVGALQAMEMEAVAIIGPQSSITAHVLSHIANELHVPLLSFTALDSSLSPLQYPYFFQTAPNDQFQMSAIADIMNYFRWTQVIAIFTDEEQSRNGISVLGDKLTERRCKISYKAVLPPVITGNEIIVMKELSKVKMMESRVLVVHTSPTSGPLLLKALDRLGMLTHGYVWIATSWLSTILDSQPRPEIFRLAQGFVTLRLHTPSSQRKKAFVARWNHLSKGSIGLNVYGLYAYDTVWLIAHAVREYLNQGNHISFSNDPVLTAFGGNMNLSALSVFDGGMQLLKIILETNMTGLTGPIWFNSERFLVNPSFDVINIVGNQLKHIGYWSNYSGLSVVAPEILLRRPQNRSSESQKLYSVIWPGGDKQQPRGWGFPRYGMKLRIAIPHRVTYQGFPLQDKCTHDACGFSIDVFLAAIRLLRYDVPYEFVPFGDGHQNPNYTDFLSRIALGEYDAAVDEITVTSSRMKIVDFTQPYASSGMVVVAPAKKLSSNPWGFLGPFTSLMWAMTALFVFIVGAVIWLLEHRSNDEFRGPPRRQLMTLLWFSLPSLCFPPRVKTMTVLGRMVLVIWLFVVLIIQSIYKASLTSFLTAQRLSSSINGIDSLISATGSIGFPANTFVENYLHEELHIPKSRLKALNSPEDFADALEKKRVAAVVDLRLYMDKFVSKYCQFAIAGQEFTKADWAFAFKKDSPLSLDISTALLELSENGSLQNITETWVKNRTTCRQHNKSDQFQLGNFSGIFLVCGVACIVALIIYFCLVKCQCLRHLPQEPDPSSSANTCSTRLRTFLPRRRLKRRHLSKASNHREKGGVGPSGTSSRREELDIVSGKT